MVDAATGTGRRNDWGFHEEPPPAPVTTGTTGKAPHVGWNRDAPPVVVTPAGTFVHPLLPDLSSIAKLMATGNTATVGAEVMKLKAQVTSDPSLRQPLIMKQAEWVTRAKAEGRTPPMGALDPFRSTPKEIINAFQWSEAGGIVPRDELARDGGKAFHESIRDAVVLRMQGFDALLSLHEGEPDVQRGFLAQELARRGVSVPKDADVIRLRALYAESVRNESSRQKTMGLDGRVGTAEQVDTYWRGEAIDAMNPGTTLGSIMTTYSVVATGEVDVDRMRAMGNAGNAAEGMLGGSGVHLQAVAHEREAPGTLKPDIDDFNRTGLKPRFDVTPMNAHYEGEQRPGNGVWNEGPTRTREVRYASRPVDRAPFKVEPREVVIAGKKEVRLFDAEGKPFDTRGAETHEGNARAIFVMNAQGELFASTYQEVAYMHHSSLSGGEPVAAAGELIVENGKLVGITNQSGHYRPDGRFTEQLITSLRSQGLDLSGVKVKTIGADPFAPDERILP